MKKAIVDTTVQEKAITYPTDAKLFQTGRKWLVRLAKKHNLCLRQTHEILGKKTLFQQHYSVTANDLPCARITLVQPFNLAAKTNTTHHLIA